MKLRTIYIIFFLFISKISFAQHVHQYVDSIRKAYNIPELNYAVINENSILDIQALGKHAMHLKDSAAIKDRFHLGSNTKAMTAFVIAKYVELGKLQWDTKFFAIFPEWKSIAKSEYHAITLQDLLSHRARIQPFQGEDDPVIPNFKGSKTEKRKQFGKFVLTTNPVPIDTLQNFTYSNADYTLASLMLEKVTKKSWEKLVEKVYNQDLELNVLFSWPENQKKKDTWGHKEENGKLVPIPSTTDYQLDYTEPAGDLNCSILDYIKYIQFNLSGLKGKDNYLSAKTYQYLHKGIANYALGWYNIYENNQELSTHSGNAGSYYTLVHIDRLHYKAYIIFTNSYNNDTKQGVRLVMRKLKASYGN